jgi:hypothetical protein
MEMNTSSTANARRLQRFHSTGAPSDIYSGAMELSASGNFEMLVSIVVTLVTCQAFRTSKSTIRAGGLKESALWTRFLGSGVIGVRAANGKCFASAVRLTTEGNDASIRIGCLLICG